MFAIDMQDEESSYIFDDADPSPNIDTNNFGQLLSDFQTNKQLSTDENRYEIHLYWITSLHYY
jgi:hypothetical protein